MTWRGCLTWPGELQFRVLRTTRVYSLQVMLSKFETGMGERRLRNPSFADGPFSLVGRCR
jgi:hypothetical protein